ncbi:MAG TPA: 16S rRNA (guanine(966)-N(2))-methyltransferase RsmD, partial [Epsilonproteobacteria bacterium]|nr:16S rRNA (guanine(966)-N(2))-methyltransferase RsmD [Campylobacterota bacterium]
MKHAKSFSTQIIAGRFKGKLLEIPNIKTTRASKSIIRGSLFDTL